MSVRYINPVAITAMRAVVLAVVPAFMLSVFPFSLPIGDGEGWLSSAQAKGDGGSDDSGSSGRGSDDDSGSDSDDDSGNSGSDDDDYDDDDKFSGDPTPAGGDLSAADELWLIQHGWQKAGRK
ncbi:MAG: hypothetical protein OEL78_02135 [Hyphomicrobiales bacterium]|nr:hypothetical protein [Hyphomicrobiales bacterium]